MPSLRVVPFLALLVLAVAAGCGGGGSARNAPGAILPGGPVGNGNTTVQVKIVVPEKTSNGRRRPAFISPSSQSVIVEIVGPVPTASPTATPMVGIVGVGYTNLTPSSPNCTSTSAGLTCNVSVNAQISAAGNYEMLVATTDAPQTSTSCLPSPGPVPTAPPSPTALPSGVTPSPVPTGVACAGNVLSFNVVLATITPGTSNAVNVSLGGFPVYLQPYELNSGLIGGQGGALTVYGPGSASASFRLLDADKNVILGAGSMQLSVTSATTLTATVTATPDPTGLFTITLTPTTTAVGGQNIVTAGLANLFITETIPNSLGTGLTETLHLPVTVMHSIIYVAKSGGTVDAYMDGNNTTPAYTVYGSGASQLGLGVDPIDESLWVADQNAGIVNNDVITWNLGQPGGPPPENSTFCGIGGTQGGNTCNVTSSNFKYPQYLAFDSSGNLFMSNGYPSVFPGFPSTVMQFNAPSASATPNPGLAPAFTYPAGGTTYFCHLMIDNTGHLFVGADTPNIVNFTIGSASGTMFNTANINGIAYAPDGSIWYVSVPLSGTETIYKANATTAATQLSIPGLVNYPYQSIAVDSLGNLYVAPGTGSGITEYTASSNWSSSSTIAGASSGATYVVVFPDGLFGSNQQIGVPKPNQSPIPIATPLQL